MHSLVTLHCIYITIYWKYQFIDRLGIVILVRLVHNKSMVSLDPFFFKLKSCKNADNKPFKGGVRAYPPYSRRDWGYSPPVNKKKKYLLTG